MQSLLTPFLLTALASAAAPLAAKGLDNLAPAKVSPLPTEDAADTGETEADPVAQGEPTAPVTPPEVSPEAPPAQTIPPGEASAPAAVATAIPTAPPSALSQTLSSRLSLGTSVGLSKVKPSTGAWEGTGFSSLDAAWRLAEGGNLFVTGRYTPYAGTWKVDNRYYNTTFHTFLAGAAWQFPGIVAGANLKAGVELGYTLVYAKPQDGNEADSKVKAGKVAVASGGDFAWTILDKVEAGPFLGLSFGGAQIVQGGAKVSFIF